MHLHKADILTSDGHNDKIYLTIEGVVGAAKQCRKSTFMAFTAWLV